LREPDTPLENDANVKPVADVAVIEPAADDTVVTPVADDVDVVSVENIVNQVSNVITPFRLSYWRRGKLSQKVFA